MDRTAKAKRATSKKVITKQLKEQNRNAKKVAKRIERLKKKLWELELAEFCESGLLSQLIWEYEPRVSLFNCEGTGFRSKENTSNSEAVKKIQEWFWSVGNEKFDFVEISYKVVNDYHILLGLKMGYAIDDDYDGPMVVEIFAIDTDETGTGVPTEKSVVNEFAKKWNMSVGIP